MNNTANPLPESEEKKESSVRKELNRQNRHYLETINNEVFFRPEEYIHYCEQAYTSALRKVAAAVTKGDGNKIIMLAGPSSSGKTTSANKLSRIISRRGHKSFVIHLDDFYKNRDEVSLGADGKPDFESIQALDLSLLESVLNSLEQNGTASLPFFDFIHGVRVDNTSRILLDPGDVVIVEGLHALNPLIDNCLSKESLIRLFVCIDSNVYQNNGTVLFDSRTIRFLRRLIRDYNYRNSSVNKTFEMWPDVIRGEEKNLFPFKDNADYIIDSIHPYELCIYRDRAQAMLSEPDIKPEYFSNAGELADKLSLVEPLDQNMVPRSSLLNEFILRTE